MISVLQLSTHTSACLSYNPFDLQVRNCILQALPVARGGDDGETTSSTPPPAVGKDECSRLTQFETSLAEADDPLAFRLIKHLSDDSLVDLLRSLVVNSYGVDPPLLRSVPSLPYHLVEQMGRNHLWDMTMTDVTEVSFSLSSISHVRSLREPKTCKPS